MSDVTTHRFSQQANGLISGAGMATAGFLALFASMATPMVSEFAQRFDFKMASYSVAVLREPRWPVVLVGLLGMAAFLVKDRMIAGTRARLVSGSVLALPMLVMLVAYVFCVLDPIARVEWHMKMLDAQAQVASR